MSGFGWKIDLRPAVAGEIRKKCESAVSDLTEYLLETANRTVPIEEYSLEDSGKATTDGLKGIVSYDTPYACKQHEELGYQHDAGRRAKWLELTFKEEEPKALDFLAERIDF